MALQRVRSLAQRNRLALDKLSRLGSPSPARPNTPNSRSPALSASSSSRLLQPPRQSRSSADTPPLSAQDLGRSGSETERESTTQTYSHSSHSSSSHSRAYSMSSPRHQSSTLSSSNRSVTPPPAGTQNSPYSRNRHLSAPGSPNKVRNAMSSAASSASNSNSNSSSSPSNRRRHRQSMASMSQLQLTDFEEEEDGQDDNLRTATGTRGHTRDKTLNERDLITQSALAAVASSRRSPVGRRRGALPKEFRADLVEQSPSVRPGSAGRRRTQDVYESRDAYDKDARRESWKNVEPVTPMRATQNAPGRSFTLRETRRTGASPRWSSDDYRTSTTLRDRQYGAIHSTDDLNAQKERRQSLRGGSMESALGGWSPGGRSLLGEGLRAAGLSRKKDEERIQGDTGPSSATTVSFKDSPRGVDWSPQDVLDQGRRRVFTDRERDRQLHRPSTSMADYQYIDRNEGQDRGGRDVALRSYKSSYPLSAKDREPSLSRPLGDSSVSRRERDSLPPPERAASSMARYSTGMTLHTSSPAPSVPAHLLERGATGSPFSSRRFTQPPLSSSQPSSEHTRLLFESLAMFEAQLGKLPPQLGSSMSSMNSSTGVGASHAELSRNVQGTVYAAERLASMLKLSSARAMEAQVEAEVDSTTRERSQDIIDLWSRVGSDYRDGSRAADELVRTLTSVLLGVGRIMRDFGAAAASEMGSPSLHGRNASLSEDDLDYRAGSNGSGRQSVASRNSWEHTPRDRERDREEALRRLDGTSRADSVLARASPATFQRLRDREQLEAPSPASLSRNSGTRPEDKAAVSGTFRRLFTPREQRQQTLDARDSPNSMMATMDSQETVQGQYVEPSPTPASKTRPPAPERQRTLTPLSIPKPLPTLPSESANRRPSISLNVSTNGLEKPVPRKPTLRGERPSFPAITSPSIPTTALTHVSTDSPLARTNSERSTRSQVTFSRPSTVSVSAALNDIQQQDGERMRTTSTSSSSADPPKASVIPERLLRSVSGSETERDIRRKTLGKTPRASLDTSQRDRDERSMLTASGTRLSTANVNAADRSAASTILQQSAGAKRDHRRTVTDIWPRE
ncbi:hypothetical protein BDN70DRAFT_566397 [Pholiota conissans]|uniref:Uncharacterized protein n=1 Tax=Pholiota conissans TaxID=109636 RepID=A0A9P6CVU5_9AGAR|nr:hypothetical protein BDN70DRAFT_566397 [Pholiota conissans]